MDAKQSESCDCNLPLHLCQVLEEEFVSIHKDFPEDFPVNGWLLDESQLKKNGEGLISTLQQADTVANVIYKKLKIDSKVPLTVSSVIHAINELLEAPNKNAYERLYDLRKFSPLLDADDLRELEDASKLSLKDEDLIRINRRFLDAALPDHIENIYTARLRRLFCAIHKLNEGQDGNLAPRAALCLSGGGIRSGSFALGVLQGLAERRLLSQFDYLSTVSGGGYIGSWLTAWIHRHQEGLAGVEKDLATPTDERKIEPEAKPIRFLRDYSNFLVPKLGIFTADTWAWIGIYLRNLILIWLMLIPAMFALLAVPRLYAAFLGVAADWPLLTPILSTLLPIIVVTFLSLSLPSLSDPASGKNASGPVKILNDSWPKLKTQGAAISFAMLTVLFAVVLSAHFFSALRGKELDVLHTIGLGLIVTTAGWIMGTIPVRHSWHRGTWIEWLSVVTATTVTCGLLYYLATMGNAFLQSTDELGPMVGYPFHVYVVFAVPAILAVLLVGQTIFIGLVSRALKTDKDEDQEWWGRFGGLILFALVAWVALNGVVVFGPPFLYTWPKLFATLGGAAWLAAIVFGKSRLTPAVNRASGNGAIRSLLADFGLSSLALVALAFLIIFSAGLALLTTLALVQLSAPFQQNAVCAQYHLYFSVIGANPAQQHWESICGTSFSLAGILLSASLFLAVLFGWIVNLNKFSLHGAYRNRIIRAFLGASRVGDRNPNLFTGFDPLDNLRMHELQMGLLHSEDLRPEQAAKFIDLLRSNHPTAAREKSLPGHVVMYQNVHVGDMAGELKEIGPEKLLKDKFALRVSQLINRAMGIMGLSKNSPLETASFHSANMSNADFTESEVKCATWLLHYMKMHDDGNVVDNLKNGDSAGMLKKELKLQVLQLINQVMQKVDLCEDLSKGISSPFAKALSENEELKKWALRYSRYRALSLVNRAALQAAFGNRLTPYQFPPPPPRRLFHVINLTLNLVHGRRLAWRQRKAAPFAVTARHSGSYYLGFRESLSYGGAHGISLGTAATISGAAVSPNMGYSSSPILGFVLTLFNVRLGWWLGNPGIPGNRTVRISISGKQEATSERSSPHMSLGPLLSEAFGLTDDRSPYIYLSDGGHFDNLGLFEMVLRRCGQIVVSDASADPHGQGNDLANAIRKIRIDLGIPIEFDDFNIYSRNDDDVKRTRGRYCAVGRIRYSVVDGDGIRDGVLIYFKPAIYGTEPRDIVHYAAEHQDFPHESTSDQFFDEPQFESYRMLGLHAVRASLKTSSEHSFVDRSANTEILLSDFLRKLEGNLKSKHE